MTNDNKSEGMFTCGRCQMRLKKLSDADGCEVEHCWLKSQEEVTHTLDPSEEDELGKRRRQARLQRQLAAASVDWDRENLITMKPKAIIGTAFEDLCEEDQDIFHPKPFVPYWDRHRTMNSPPRIGESMDGWVRDTRSGIWRRTEEALREREELEGDQSVRTPFDEIGMAHDVRAAWEEFQSGVDRDDDSLIDPRTLH